MHTRALHAFFFAHCVFEYRGNALRFWKSPISRMHGFIFRLTTIRRNYCEWCKWLGWGAWQSTVYLRFTPERDYGEHEDDGDCWDLAEIWVLMPEEPKTGWVIHGWEMKETTRGVRLSVYCVWKKPTPWKNWPRKATTQVILMLCIPINITH